MDSHVQTINDNLSGELLSKAHINTAKCYQCGKCSAGCPLVNEMDYSPSMVMRMLQLGEQESDKELLHSKTIWLCLTCEMCISRCPMEVDIPTIMDFMRQESLNKGMQNKASKKIIAFHKSFLGSIKRTGRLHEMGLIIEYKMRTFNLLQDVLLAPVMFAKGKLHILPEKVRNRKQIQQIFTKTKPNKEVAK